jgi:exodeoxyribonuclease VII small subunit
MVSDRKLTLITESAEGGVEAFEAAFRELQEVIEQLEEGGLGLEASVRLFERGMDLASKCEKTLEKAELRVIRLMPEHGSPLSDFSADGVV